MESLNSPTDWNSLIPGKAVYWVNLSPNFKEAVHILSYIPTVGAVLTGTVEVLGVVQGLIGVAFEGRTGQLPTVN